MNNQIEIHNKNAFKKMHNAGALAADVLDYITQLSLIHISEPTRQEAISYAVFCLKKKKTKKKKKKK